MSKVQDEVGSLVQPDETVPDEVSAVFEDHDYEAGSSITAPEEDDDEEDQ